MPMTANKLLKFLHFAPDADLRPRADVVQSRSPDLMQNLRGLFLPSPDGDTSILLDSQKKTKVAPNTQISFQKDAGLVAEYSRPPKRSTTSSPPDFERQFMLKVTDPGKSGWFGLVTRIDAEPILAAKDFYFEISVRGSIEIRMNFDIRFHSHTNDSCKNFLGFTTIGTEPTCYSKSVHIDQLKVPDDPSNATLHLFFALDKGFDAHFDYIIAHYG